MSELGVSRHTHMTPGENGGVVLLHGRTGQCYFLDRAGAAFWTAMTEEGSFEAAVPVLARRYPMIARERIVVDLRRFTHELTDAGLMAPRSRRAAPEPGPRMAAAAR